jgi:riboflavin-specific deaminase-like protein
MVPRESPRAGPVNANIQGIPRPASESPDPDIYLPLQSGAPVVIGQLGQSLDGRIATATGDSRYVNCEAALHHLHRLRALVDAVVVGVGTVVADDPQLTVRHVAGRDPVRVVIDPFGRVPHTARMFGTGGPCLIFCRSACTAEPPKGAEVIPLPSDGRGWIDPANIVAALAQRGLKRLLIEGGATTISHFVASGALDRLHLAVAPVLIGAGPTGITLPPVARLALAPRPPTRIFRLGNDVLFDCDMAALRQN